jgi:hypothetical protein
MLANGFELPEILWRNVSLANLVLVAANYERSAGSASRRRPSRRVAASGIHPKKYHQSIPGRRYRMGSPQSSGHFLVILYTGIQCNESQADAVELPIYVCI